MINYTDYYPLIVEFKQELEQALNQFGTYAFDDKGAHEVLDLEAMASKVRALAPEIAANLIHEMYISYDFDGRLSSLASQICFELNDWDELYEQELMDQDEW